MKNKIEPVDIQILSELRQIREVLQKELPRIYNNLYDIGAACGKLSPYENPEWKRKRFGNASGGPQDDPASGRYRG